MIIYQYVFKFKIKFSLKLFKVVCILFATFKSKLTNNYIYTHPIYRPKWLRIKIFSQIIYIYLVFEEKNLNKYSKMFYEEKQIYDITKCNQCKEILDEPRILPCGFTICSSCVDLIKVNEK